MIILGRSGSDFRVQAKEPSEFCEFSILGQLESKLQGEAYVGSLDVDQYPFTTEALDAFRICRPTELAFLMSFETHGHSEMTLDGHLAVEALDAINTYGMLQRGRAPYSLFENCEGSLYATHVNLNVEGGLLTIDGESEVLSRVIGVQGRTIGPFCRLLNRHSIDLDVQILGNKPSPRKRHDWLYAY